MLPAVVGLACGYFCISRPLSDLGPFISSYDHLTQTVTGRNSAALAGKSQLEHVVFSRLHRVSALARPLFCRFLSGLPLVLLVFFWAFSGLGRSVVILASENVKVVHLAKVKGLRETIFYNVLVQVYI